MDQEVVNALVVFQHRDLDIAVLNIAQLNAETNEMPSRSKNRTMKRASSAHRRSLLHRDKLEEFKAWILDGQGYFEMPKTNHTYEVFRIRKYNPSGDEPDIFFYQKLPPCQHVTLCKDGEELVKAWLRATKAHKPAKVLRFAPKTWSNP